jgi:hypothetical protein
MLFNEFTNIFQTPFLDPWEHDYYAAFFHEPKSAQEFLDCAYTKIENLKGLWYEVRGNVAYFIVPKDTVIPAGFSDSLQVITEVPKQPAQESE